MTRTLLLSLCSFFLILETLAQSPSQRASVMLSATVQSSPPRITLNWEPFSGTSSITIYRKLKTETSWGSSIASPGGSSTQYQDNSVQVGVAYEYKVVRSASSGTGTGYIASGIEVPMVDYRGKMVLLVDNTLAPQMVSELEQLTRDLKADGWWVLRNDVSRTAPASSIRNIVMGHYNSDPTNVKAVYMVGHVPVPYSGNQAPDGHGEHVGAWPADGYYGEMTSTWTDATVNNNGAQRTANRNIPGDGKFDQSTFPSDVELQVGRVDLYDMPAFSQSEVQLVKNYLNRAHSFKIKGWTPLMRGLMFDNLQWVSNPIGGSGLRNMGPLAGPSNVTNANQNGTAFHNLVNGESYLWTYSSGGGGQLVTDGVLTFNGANNIGTTQNYAANGSMGGVFNMSCGSYFGDWDNKNNFLRAPIAKGDALTSVWAGIPAWYFHHMGMGDNIGYSTRETMNNNGLYTPITEGWQGSIGKVHLALHGDPSLRMQMVAPPTSLTVSNAGGTAAFNWTASSETVLGYHIYKFNTNGTITKLTTSPVTGTSFQNAAIPFEAGREYMVRAVKLQVNYSGSYFNLSLGALATAAGSSTPTDCAGVSGGSAVPGTPCNDNDPCTTNDTWNSNCQCVGTPSTVTASINAAGPTSFCQGGNVVLNANTGSGLSYVWRRDGNTINGATSASYTADQAGVYTVRVSNGGCEATSSGVTVNITSSISASITAGGPTTFCGGGSVVLNASSSSGSSYVWRRDGNTISGANSASYTATEAGVYTVQISNGGCTSTSSGTTVAVTSSPIAAITAAGPTSFCSGGSVALNATTGSGFSYVWRRDGNTISGANSADYTADQSGIYTVQISHGGCTTTSSGVTVTMNSMPSALITAAGPTNFCGGGSVVLNANTGSGFSYTWRRDGVAISGANGASFTATQAGAYTVQVNNGGCISTSSSVAVTLTSAPSALITAAGSTSFCNGGSVVLNANTGSGLSYVWRRDGNTISGATSASFTADQAGVYTVQVGDGACSTTSTGTTVTITSSPSASITAAGATSFCQGGSVVLNANTGNGFTYVWRRDGSIINGETNASYTATQSGNYTVQVGHNGCTNTSWGITVTTAPVPTASITSSGSTDFCSGGSVTLSANTGNGLTHSWSRNGVVITGAIGSDHIANVSGAYTVAVSNGICTTVSDPINVSVNSGPTASITVGGSSEFCVGGNVTLLANTAPGVSYSWQLNGQSLSGASAASFTAVEPGVYTVTISGNGCSAVSAPVTLSTFVTAAPVLAVDGSTLVCAGESATISTEEDLDAVYQWSFNGSPYPAAAGASFYASEAGVVSLQVINDGCVSAAAEVEITIAELPESTLTSFGPTHVCTGDTVLLQAIQDSSYTYTWMLDGAIIIDASANTHGATVPGDYTVLVDNGQCVNASAPVHVDMMPNVAVTTSGPVSFCLGDSVTISAIEEVGYTYSWSVDGVIADETSPAIVAEASGSYVVTIESANCSASSEPIEVAVFSVPEAMIEAAGPLMFCAGDSVELSSAFDPEWTYQWNHDGEMIAGAEMNSLTAHMNGAYSLDVTNGGCTVNSGLVIVTTLPIVALELDGPSSFCEGDSVTIGAIAASDYTYTWFKDGNILADDTTHTITTGISGDYHVSITDGECTANSEVIAVSADQAPEFGMHAFGMTTFCSGDSVMLMVSSNDATYGIQWSLNGNLIEGVDGDSLFASAAGHYTAIVSNGGCALTSDVVDVVTLPEVSLELDGPSAFCEGDGVLISTIYNSSYTYQWILDGELLLGENGHQLLVVGSGSYNVAVQGDGCSAISPSIELEMLEAPELNCYADVSMGMVGVDVLSGNGPFTYMWNGDADQDSSIAMVDISGLYLVSVTDANGCFEVCEVEVIMAGEDEACIGLRTETQAYWPGSTELIDGFDVAFADGLTIGCGFRTLILTDAQAVAEFLPSTGPAQRLPFGLLIDPGTAYGNSLAGELVALKLAVRFDELDAQFSSSNDLLKDAVVASGQFQGMTVAEVIEEADKKIGGCFSWFSRNQLRNALANINTGYAGGTVASGYLECPEPATRPIYEGVVDQVQDPEVTSTAFPNPFVENTTIVVSELEQADRIIIEILSTDGVVIERLFEGEVPAGVETRVDWNASSRAMGVYYYRVSSSQRMLTGKLVRQ